jgi:hypothetical protein
VSGAQAVHDAVANKNETLEHHAEVLAASKIRRTVFEEVYRGRGQPKTAKAIMASTGLSQKTVLTAGQALIGANMVVREEALEGGRKVIAFGKNDFCRNNRDIILRLAANPVRRKSIPTKRKVVIQGDLSVAVNIPSALVRAKFVTIDQIDSFNHVIGITSLSSKTSGFSETDFKEGIQRVIGEHATFKDWGGEKSDLMTTRLIIGGRRCRAAFAFKGPGLRSKLVPGKMGKNGDQCQRLFSEDADIFIVHHWREIDPSVIELMKIFAIAKSVMENREVMYCVIDGQDSNRLISAYPAAFS